MLTKTVTTTDKHVFEPRVKRSKKRLTSTVEEQKPGLQFNHGLCKEKLSGFKKYYLLKRGQKNSLAKLQFYRSMLLLHESMHEP